MVIIYELIYLFLILVVHDHSDFLSTLEGRVLDLQPRGVALPSFHGLLLVELQECAWSVLEASHCTFPEGQLLSYRLQGPCLCVPRETKQRADGLLWCCCSELQLLAFLGLLLCHVFPGIGDFSVSVIHQEVHDLCCADLLPEGILCTAFGELSVEHIREFNHRQQENLQYFSIELLGSIGEHSEVGLEDDELCCVLESILSWGEQEALHQLGDVELVLVVGSEFNEAHLLEGLSDDLDDAIMTRAEFVCLIVVREGQIENELDEFDGHFLILLENEFD